MVRSHTCNPHRNRKKTQRQINIKTGDKRYNSKHFRNVQTKSKTQ